MARRPHPSDVSDDEWAFVAPYLALLSEDAGQRRHDLRKAFDPNNGPLTEADDPFAEREGLAALFAGAIGSYKNPHSHSTVEIGDAREAQEMVILASHLLRIVDARQAG